jgi:hypothetical protein
MRWLVVLFAGWEEEVLIAFRNRDNRSYFRPGVASIHHADQSSFTHGENPFCFRAYPVWDPDLSAHGRTSKEIRLHLKGSMESLHNGPLSKPESAR